MSDEISTLISNIDCQRLEKILDQMTEKKVALIGDVVLDVYWKADMNLSELSLETPHYTLPIIEERYSPGGGGNVAKNLKHLGLREVKVLSVFGRDWRGDILTKLLREEEIKLNCCIQDDNWVTPAYCKPIKTGISNVTMEAARLDFKNFKKLLPSSEKFLYNGIKEIFEKYDAVGICDQLKYGIINDNIIDSLNKLSSSKLVLVDSRSQIKKFRNAILKPNQTEITNAFKARSNISSKYDLLYYKKLGKKLSLRNDSPVILTLGENGALWINKENKAFHIPTKPEKGPVDIVGAGDTFMASVLAALACQAEPEEALTIGNMAASVVVKKINRTGTASRQEILNKYKELAGGK